MSEITVYYRDGSSEVFPETSRPGGSWQTSGKTVDGWFIVTDAYHQETAIPESTIQRVVTNAPSRSW